MLTNNEREEVIKMIPPAGVTVTTICGITLADWVYIATFIYIIIHILFKKERPIDFQYTSKFRRKKFRPFSDSQ